MRCNAPAQANKGTGSHSAGSELARPSLNPRGGNSVGPLPEPWLLVPKSCVACSAGREFHLDEEPLRKEPTLMARKPKIATTWKSRHMGNCFIDRTSAGWVASLLHSEGITGPSDFLVPFQTADGRRRRPLAARLRRLLRSMITELGDVRRVSGREAVELLRPPKLGLLWRKGGRWDPPGAGNWNGRGRLCPWRSQSGLAYLAARTDRGWLVLLRSLWGSPCGSYLVPFDKVPFRGEKWDADFFARPLRWHLSHILGVRKIDFDEAERLRGWEEDLLDDQKAA